MTRVQVFALLFGLLVTSASALPGQATTPQAAGVTNLLLRSDEARKLVFINNVQILDFSPFTSQAGKKHLRFKMSVGGVSYNAVMFEGDWRPQDQAILKKGKAHLLGVWGAFDGKPSFTALRAVSQPITHNPKAAKAPATLVIRNAQILTATVSQFESASKKQHITFSFVTQGKTYQGIVYEGDRSEDTAKLLRSGKVNLYGKWSEYNNKPSFVIERVEK